MASSSETLCPIDEHDCGNPECLLHPHFPICRQICHAQAPATAFLDKFGNPAQIQEHEQQLRQLAILLNIEPQLFLDNLRDEIQGPGSA